MRQLFIIIVIAAAGYLAYTYYQEYLAKTAGPNGETADAGEAQSSRVDETGQPVPVFHSKIDISPGPPGEKRLAEPGVFYMLERVSEQTDTGVHAVVPGEQVRLLRRKDKMLRLTDGVIEFEVKESQVTNDLELAREAERKDFEAHPRRR